MLQNVFDAINPKVVSLGFEIVDVEKRTEYGSQVITVYVDKVPEGVDLNDCEFLTGELEPLLDELDPTDGKPYVFEVSSPGLDRPFKTQRDYERNYGKEVEVKLYAPLKGKKTYEGVLSLRTENYVIITVNGEEEKIEANKIALVRPLVKFE